MTKDVFENLKAYLDGELEPEQAEEVRRALEGDMDLQREAETMRSISKSLSSLRPLREPSREMAEKAAARLSRPSRSILRAPWIWAGACGMLLIAVFARPLFESAQHEVPVQDAATERKSEVLRDQAPATGSYTDSQTEAASPAASEIYIQESSIVVRTQSIDASLRDVESIASIVGASIETDTSSLPNATKQGDRTIVLRVEPSRFESARKQLLTIQGSTETHVTYRNVTEEMQQLEKEVARQQDSQQFGSIQGRLSELRDLAARSTIRIHIILES
jgi:anti-sigma factor RsiW